jgi:phosphoribulokinase
VSVKHPIISVTGSSGAGTTSVRRTFEQIFRREGIVATCIEGDAFHRYDRAGMKAAMLREQKNNNFNFSHFGPDANLLEELEALFREYNDNGGGRTRHYVHDADEAEFYGLPSGTFTPWEDLPKDTELLFYEGLHGAVVTDSVNTAQYADLKIGVVPVINLEWIQKIHRDRVERGHSEGTIVETILGRMPDYVHFICPQFTQTDINF